MTKQARTFLIQQPHLVLSRARLGELETDTTTRQLSVDLRVGIESVINTSLLLLIEDDLQDLAAIFLGAETLADDLDGVDEVGEDGVVNGGECSGTGSLLSLRGTGAVGALWAGENATRGKEEDVAVGELLLELTGETLLHTVEALEGWDGDKDDNSLLAVANFDLSGGDDLKRAESGLEVGGVALKVVKSTSNAGLELAGLRARWAVGRDLVDGTHDCGLS